MALGKVSSALYAQYYRGSIFNNQMIEHFATTGLSLTQAEHNILKGVTTALAESGNMIAANHYIYFKLFCNVFVRARLNNGNINIPLPVINNNNSRIYVQTGLTAPATNFTAENLLRYGAQQNIVFESQGSNDVFITMYEILGYEGMYFNSNPCSNPNIQPAPSSRFSFHGVPCVLFVPNHETM